MGSLFNLDNPIWRFMGKLVDVFILTLLWAVCCIPIITIGPKINCGVLCNTETCEG